MRGTVVRVEQNDLGEGQATDRFDGEGRDLVALQSTDRLRRKGIELSGRQCSGLSHAQGPNVVCA